MKTSLTNLFHRGKYFKSEINNWIFFKRCLSSFCLNVVTCSIVSHFRFWKPRNWWGFAVADCVWNWFPGSGLCWFNIFWSSPWTRFLCLLSPFGPVATSFWSWIKIRIPMNVHAIVAPTNFRYFEWYRFWPESCSIDANGVF